MDLKVTIEPVADGDTPAARNIPASITFPPARDEIVLGREKTSDVVFPPDARIVSRTHGRIFRQPSGDYAIEPFGDHYIEMDGYPVERGQHVRDGAMVRLGGKSGPLLRVRIERAEQTAATGHTTLAQERVVSVHKRMGAMRRYQFAGLAAVMLVAAAMAYLYAFRLPDYDVQMADLRAGVEAAAKDDIRDTSALMAAAWAVVLKERGGTEKLIGTAWPYADGLVVTNAHVAVVQEMLKPGEALVVRKPDGSREFNVLDHRLHPAYKPFKDFIAWAKENNTGFRSMVSGLVMAPAYDVAVLVVDPPTLGMTLPVVPDPGPQHVAPGTSLAFAGYPIEGTGAQKSAQLGQNAQLQFGSVTSNSDFFLFHAQPEFAYLVQNSLPATGGASGSPVINKDGYVVAVLSGGTVVATGNGGRAPSAVLLNYAQRADLIAGAVDPSSFDVEAERSRWMATLSRFDDYENKVVADAQAALEQQTGKVLSGEMLVQDGSLATGDSVKAGTVQYRNHEVKVEAGKTYSFLVYGDQGSSLSLALFRETTGLGGRGGGRWFSSMTFTAEADETLVLRVIGEAANPVPYKLYVMEADGPLLTAAAN